MTQLADNNVAAVAEAPVTDGAATDLNPNDPSSLYPDDAPREDAEEVNPSGVENTSQEEGEGVEPAPDPEAELVEAIDPPVSWDKEAKEKFSQLPPDMQAFVAEQEAHRNKQVQQVTTRAAEAQRQAQEAVAAQTAEAQQYFAQQLEAVVYANLPPEPNPAHYQDMQSYGLAKEAWSQQVNQQRGLLEQAQGMRTQAEQVAQKQQQAALIQDAKRVMVELPELNDSGQYQQLVQDLTPIAKELGYDDERIAQAWPSDVLAMKRVQALKAKADKWDKLQAQKMASVRQAKALPRVMQPGAAGQAQSKPKSDLEILYPDDVRRS